MPGIINVDFDDLKAVLKNAGFVSIGVGRASGESRAAKAAKMAVNSKLSEHIINEAKSIIVNIKGDSSLSLWEVTDIVNIIKDAVDEDSAVIIGVVTDESIQDEVQITVIATGLDNKKNCIKK